MSLLVDPTTIVLSDEQKAGLSRLLNFVINKDEKVIVLEGYAGCGKSTLMAAFVDQLPNFLETMNLLTGEKHPELVFTATTHKAANNLEGIIGQGVQTIHSLLGLFPKFDAKSRTTSLATKKNFEPPENLLVVIDEASQMDWFMDEKIHQNTKKCKFILIGDPAQLLAVNATSSPVFSGKYPKVQLYKVMRQAEGNPIIQLSTMFRHAVNTGEWGQFKPDGVAIQHLPRDKWMALMEQDMCRSDWKFHDSKALAFTNNAVTFYNKQIRNKVKGTPDIEVGDLCVVNSFVSKGDRKIATDALVEITGITEGEEHQTKGKYYECDRAEKWFMPNDRTQIAERMKQASKEEDYNTVNEIQREWVDLRAAYASTVHKSQGSTYKRVFIDLEDIARCSNGNTIARLCYVATSRASEQVFFTGDFG